ncbi:MAG: M48 family metallopeptidase [Gemmatimonadota bacterium]
MKRGAAEGPPSASTPWWRARPPGPWAGLALVAVAAGIAVALGGPDPRTMPVDPASVFDPAHRRLAAEYAEIKYSLWATGTLLRWGFLAGLLVLAGGVPLSRLGRRIGRGRPLPSSFLTAVLLLAALVFVALPVAWTSGFLVEHRFGLSTRSAGAWLLDTARRQGFWIVVYGLAAAGFLGCLRRWPRWGWVAAAAGGTLMAVAGTTVAPVLIDPLFADFRPLDDRELEREIVAMGERAGLKIERVRVVDASRRTRRLNAYVAGLGATRQVVLYDNLLVEAPREEILLVVAHELGHAGERHVRTGLLLAIPGIFAGAWLLTGVARWQARRNSRLAGPGDPAGLPLLWLAVSILLFLASPIEGAISRRMEAEADWIALELSRDPDTFARVTRRLARSNLSPLTPPGWIVRWFYTHPPVLERIGMSECWRENGGPRGILGTTEPIPPR